MGQLWVQLWAWFGWTLKELRLVDFCGFIFYNIFLPNIFLWIDLTFSIGHPLHPITSTFFKEWWTKGMPAVLAWAFTPVQVSGPQSWEDPPHFQICRCGMRIGITHSVLALLTSNLLVVGLNLQWSSMPETSLSALLDLIRIVTNFDLIIYTKANILFKF
jgi:hypothetical protein